MGSQLSRIISLTSIAIIGVLIAGKGLKLKGKKQKECIRMITRADECEMELSEVDWDLDWDKIKIIGLYCEWSRKPIPLLQLALPDGTCYLIDLCIMNRMPPTLGSVLTNKSILKFGIEVGNDVKRIQKMNNCPVSGCVDLRNLMMRSGINMEGLKALLLGTKSHTIRCSNWENRSRSNSQKHYAAVALNIVDALVKKKLQAVEERESATSQLQMQPRLLVKVPHPLILAQLSHHHPIVKCWREPLVPLRSSKRFYSCLFSMCQGLVDLPYGDRAYVSSPTPSHKDAKVKTTHNNSVNKPASHMAVQQTPFHSCKLLLSDGTLLAIVDRKKLDWYSQRALGGIISESPPTLRLYSEEDQKFYLAEKEHQCVVCGVKQNCIRKHVIPFDYRKALSYCHKIPETIVKEIMQTLKKYYNVEEVTDEMILKAANIDPRLCNESYVPHCQKVVEELTRQGKLIEFQRSWRRHFLDSMSPLFLPPHWSIDHKCSTC